MYIHCSIISLTFWCSYVLEHSMTLYLVLLSPSFCLILHKSAGYLHAEIRSPANILAWMLLAPSVCITVGTPLSSKYSVKTLLTWLFNLMSTIYEISRLLTKITPQVLLNNDSTDKKNTSAYNFVFSQLYLYCNCFVLYLQCTGWMSLHIPYTIPSWFVAYKVLCADMIPISSVKCPFMILNLQITAFWLDSIFLYIYDCNPSRKSSSTNTGMNFKSSAITSHYLFTANIVHPCYDVGLHCSGE